MNDVMDETQKPFACLITGCEMTFTNEDHLNWHQKKHDMMLNLGLANKSTDADQTPTPTRFIRNCEEVGLFQDLQNVNPFDDIFKKAAELAKAGTPHVPEPASDDTLHTPHVLPHIEENQSKYSENRIDTYQSSEFRTLDSLSVHSSNQDNNQILVIDENSQESTKNNRDNGVIVEKIKNIDEIKKNTLKLRIKEALQNKKRETTKSVIIVNSVAPKIVCASEKKLNIVGSDENTAKESKQKIREMNRAAQLRCRKRKKMKMKKQEMELHNLSCENRKLCAENLMLRAENARLKEILLKYKNSEVPKTGVEPTSTNTESQTSPSVSSTNTASQLSSNPVLLHIINPASNLGVPILPKPKHPPSIPVSTIHTILPVGVSENRSIVVLQNSTPKGLRTIIPNIK